MSEQPPDYQDSYLPETHRTIPHSSDAEMGVLCSMFLDPLDALEAAVSRIQPEDFHIPAHVIVFKTLVHMDENLIAIDPVTVVQQLKKGKLLTQIGGVPFLNRVFEFVPTAANINYYLDIIRDKSILRQVIQTCTECVTLGYEESSDAAEILNTVNQKITAVGASSDGKKGKFVAAKKWAMDGFTAIQDSIEKGIISGLATGFTELDELTGGMNPAEMIVVAARPSMGKTAWAMNVAEHVAVDQGKKVAVFSLEMSTQQLSTRVICSRARVNLRRIQKYGPSLQDGPALSAAADKISKSNLFIIDQPGLTVMEMARHLRRLIREHGALDLVIIDYLQLIKPVKSNDSREREVASISGSIKELAKELNIPVIVLAQINRKAEGRQGGRPVVSDLRESGSIEQDADVIALLHRPEVYADNAEERSKLEGKANCIIGKQRCGPVGDIPLTFISEYARFENRSREVN